MASEHPDVHVTLRPIGSAFPLGMSGLAIASLTFSALELGWIPLAQSHQVGMILLVTVVPMQLISCLLAFAARDGAAAGLMGILAATWAVVGLKHLTSPPGATSSAVAFAVLAAGGLLLASLASVASGKPLAAAVAALIAVRFVLSGVHDLTAASAWQDASGVVGLVVVLAAAYAAVAFELEDSRHRPVLPTFRRPGGVHPPAAGIEAEPGVRRQL
jgi:succinate-acetate transporter protein